MEETVKEVGVSISEANMAKIQIIHDACVDLGVACKPSLVWPLWAPESDRATERFVSQGERYKAKPEDFAGKGRSFPILKPDDVAAALSSIGRAGADNYDSATLKANILRIAKRKGFPIPKSDESVIITLQADEVAVQESAVFCESVDLVAGAKEAALSGRPTTIPIKIIQPGWGAMAYYSKEMIQKSGPTTFKKGTQMFWNHPTSTEEAERPEGDLSSLAAVLTEDAAWQESGVKGPGLYSRAKVFSDYSTQISEKGPHIGVSINAAIKAHEGEAEGKRGRIADAFVRAFSTDFVTKAGAGGAPVVQESERVIPPKEKGMDETAVQAMQAELAAAKTKITMMEAAQNYILAVGTVAAILREAAVPFKQSLLERVCKDPVMKEGKPDPTWVEGIVADLTVEAAGKVTGLGTTPAKESDKAADETKILRESLKALGVPEAGLDAAVAGRL